MPLHALPGGRIRERLDLTFALSIDAPEAMAAAARAFPGVKRLKLKAAGAAALGAERVRALAGARPDAGVRIDANQSDRTIESESFLKRIDGTSRVRCLEQPVKSPD